MALEGKFVAEVQEYVAELTKGDDVVILDAATGAGQTTLQIAEAMNGGRLITVDCDRASWDDWAYPALKKAGLLDRVEFMQADIRKLPLETESVDLIVSDATLSAAAIYAVDAIREFYRVLKPSGRLALRDLIPEKETQDDSANISAQSWRLAKAAAHLAGREHYEELPTDWIRARLEDAGFKITTFRVDRSRRPASKAGAEEWSRMDLAEGVQVEVLKEAIGEVQRQFVERSETEGLTTKTGSYACWSYK